MSRALRRMIGAAALLGAVVVVPAAAMLVVAAASGGQVLAVESGSMAPTYAVGSALLVSPAVPSSVEAGEVLVFADERRGGALVSHRVVEVIPGDTGDLWFRTRGDANGSDDPRLVPAAQVRGVVTRHVPVVGTVLGLLRGAVGPLFVAVPLALLAASAAIDRRARHVALA